MSVTHDRPALNATLERLAGILPRRSDYAGLKTSWKVDIVAGITVGVVALPLALAFGISSGWAPRRASSPR